MIRLIIFMLITWYIVRFVRKVLRVTTSSSSSAPPPPNYGNMRYDRQDKNEIKEAEFTIIDDKK
jgi:hypothetical protein